MGLGGDGRVPFVGEGIVRSERSGPPEARRCLLKYGLSSQVRMSTAPWCDRRLPKIQSVTMPYDWVRLEGMDNDFGDGDPERNGILRLDGMRESEIVNTY